ncbi:hypothetical protein Syun_002010 [Stephania yunnanensis]|uniref:PurM-like C-terminal domain-containing protein n=1 Tax=Stephania yunnanensis TaxID=152371 RepID=A0AAP0Q715_9MAGN
MVIATMEITALDFLQVRAGRAYSQTRSLATLIGFGAPYTDVEQRCRCLSTRGSIISNSSRVLVPVRPKALVSDNVCALVDGDSAKMGDSQSKLLQETYELENLGAESFIDEEMQKDDVNVVSTCLACGLTEINRMEWSRRYLFYVEPGSGLLLEQLIHELAAMGGEAASSMVSGQNDADLDFNVVQRGDPEMAQKLYRVVRACIEMGDGNLIISIHDQEGKGFQVAVVGSINGEGRIVLVDSLTEEKCCTAGIPPPLPAIDLELEKVLGDMPQKSFEFTRVVEAR